MTQQRFTFELSDSSLIKGIFTVNIMLAVVNLKITFYFEIEGTAAIN